MGAPVLSAHARQICSYEIMPFFKGKIGLEFERNVIKGGILDGYCVFVNCEYSTS